MKLPAHKAGLAGTFRPHPDSGLCVFCSDPHVANGNARAHLVHLLRAYFLSVSGEMWKGLIILTFSSF